MNEIHVEPNVQLSEVVGRYADLGLHFTRDDGKDVLARPRKAEVAESVLTGAELRAMALEAGVPEDEAPGEDDIKARTLTFTASDEGRDRYGDRVLVDGVLDVGGKRKRFGRGWMLDEYDDNPVIMAFHMYSFLPIGTAIRTWKDTGKKGMRQLRQTMLFASAEANPAAPLIQAAFKARTMRTVSVGFMPTKMYRPVDDEERAAMDLGEYGLLFCEHSLWETSAVSIPANPRALADKGLVEVEQDEVEALRSMLPQFREAHSDFAAALADDIGKLRTFLDLGNLDEQEDEIEVATDGIVDVEPEEPAEPVAESAPDVSDNDFTAALAVALRRDPERFVRLTLEVLREAGQEAMAEAQAALDEAADAVAPRGMDALSSALAGLRSLSLGTGTVDTPETGDTVTVERRALAEINATLAEIKSALARIEGATGNAQQSPEPEAHGRGYEGILNVLNEARRMASRV